MRGVIDRIEDGIAVILIDEIEKEWTIAEMDLPEGAVAGAVLQLAETGDAFEIVSIDEEATKVATEKARNIQHKLQAKKKRSKFKRS